ncbi:MAG TPA: Holliday junction branch migration protein RuvA [Methanospirillum sp.]|nr:Holliday junction branch migration protein RuvA [Methanospirillum sp.]
MIARLRGQIVETGDDYVVIEAAGVGYRVRVPTVSAASLHHEQEAILYTEMIVRQDAILLYGFQTPAEVKLFRLLTSVSRVGPQLATAIVSRLRPEQVAGAILSGDVRLLSTVPGLGKTGAERIILELKKKGQALAAELRSSQTDTIDTAGSDAILGLMALGYTQADAASAVSQSQQKGNDGTAAGIIREALQVLKEKRSNE